MFRSREMEGGTLSGLIEWSPRVNQQPMIKQSLSCRVCEDTESVQWYGCKKSEIDFLFFSLCFNEAEMSCLTQSRN